MCGRSSLTKTESELEKRFNANFYTEDLERYNPLPSYNIAPTHYMPILTSQQKNKFQYAQWGLIPSLTKKSKNPFMMINARKETITEKKSFSNLLKRNRCIIPIDSYYEWKILNNKKKIPYRILQTNGEVFSVAGLWDQWYSEQNKLITSFTILTISAPSFIEHIHPRMPGILTNEMEKRWLDEKEDINNLVDMIQAVPEESIYYYTISQRINNVRNNDVSLIKEFIYQDYGNQLNLF